MALKVDLTAFADKVLKNFDAKPLLKEAANDVKDLMKRRIHQDGLASDGEPIGSYNSQYLKRRQQKFNRTADTKIIVSLTRQTENSWQIAESSVGWNVVLSTPLSADKLKWVGAMKGKTLTKMTKGESSYAVAKLTDSFAEYFKNL